MPTFSQPSKISVIVILFCWLMPGLLGHEPWKPDEAYTFGLIRHITRTGDWIVPMLAGEPFMEKPPIYYITAAGFLTAFGSLLGEPDAARMASGAFFLVACVFITLSTGILFGKRYRLWGILIFISCLGLPLRAHQMITDTSLLAGCSIAIYGIILGIQRPVLGALLAGSGAALAFLSKGLLGPGVLGLTMLFLPLCSREFRKAPYGLHVFITMSIFTLLVSPWLLMLWQRSETLFSTWFTVNNLGRFNGSAQLGPDAEPLFYFKLLPWYAFPALPLTIFFLWRVRKVGLKAGQFIPLIFFIFGFIVLSVASDGRELYAMPLLPPLAILGVGALLQKTCGLSEKLCPWMIAMFTVLALLFWFAGLVLMTGWPAFLWELLPAPGAPGYSPYVHLTWLITAIVITLLVAGVLALDSVGRKNPLFIFSCCITMCWALSMTLGMPYIDYTKRYSDVFISMRPYLPQQGCVASRNLGEPQRALLEYYNDIVTFREETSNEKVCNWLLYQRDKSHIADVINGYLIWSGERPGDENEEYRLYRLNH